MEADLPTCPITLEHLADPVVVPCCGKAFSRHALGEALSRQRHCPLCRASLATFRVERATRVRDLEGVAITRVLGPTPPPPAMAALEPSFEVFYVPRSRGGLQASFGPSSSQKRKTICAPPDEKVDSVLRRVLGVSGELECAMGGSPFDPAIWTMANLARHLKDNNLNHIDVYGYVRQRAC